VHDDERAFLRGGAEPAHHGVDIDRIAWDHELFTHVPEYKDGHLVVPDRPGWGTEPNEEALAVSAARPSMIHRVPPWRIALEHAPQVSGAEPGQRTASDGEVNEPVDVLIIGAGASGGAVAWSLADTGCASCASNRATGCKPSDFPSNGRDWEARRSATSPSAPTGAPARRLSDQRRRLADQGRQLQRRRRRHHAVCRALPAHASVGLSRAHARRRRRRLADRLRERSSRSTR
jgi:hypothetical protein